jgi:type IV pilus assembly protein PilC
MPTFTYTARDAKGELKTATIDAANREDGVQQLRRLRMNVVKVEEQAKAKQKTGGSISMSDILIFTRQFSTMINSGLPLVQALDILSRQSENKALQDVTHQVVYDVESGHTVADALAKHP